MREPCRARLLAWGLLALLLLVPSVGAADTLFAQDSVRRDSWQLSNGLRVVTLDVPDARAVAVTVVYPGGRDQDPRGHEGLSLLLAELQFTAAAGEVPERSREDLRSLRPLGYDLLVSRRYTEFSELASLKQFPGVLAQVAARMHGVTPTEAVWARALETTRLQLRAQFFSNPAQGLYYEVRELAARADTSAMRRLATGRGLDGLALRDVLPRLASAFTPSSAVLCIAGNLSGVPMRPLVEHEFADLAAAPPQAKPAGLPFGPGSGTEPRPDIAAPVGVVGVLAPALADSTHPSFYLSLLLMGAQASQVWGQPDPPLTSRFQYALFDDPDLARFYPQLEPDVTDPDQMGKTFDEAMSLFGKTYAHSDVLDPLRRAVGWMLGGPPTPEILHRIRTESGALRTYAWCTAVRELWGGEPFWSVYRERFNGYESAATDYWSAVLSRPQRQVRLLYRPAGRR